MEKVRDGGRVVRKCLVIAHGVHESGRREVIGLDCGEAETEAFWREFLRGLVKRGLTGVQLVVSDAHEGLKQAIAQVLGAPWQRCTVHFLREALGHARREQQPMLAALIRPIFNADSGEQARELLGDAIERLERPLPKVAALLERAEEDLLAFYTFPADHWRKLRSTNPLERLNREIGRRTDVVGIFPDNASLIRLSTSLVIEQNDEWLVGRRYLSAHSLEAVLDREREEQEREERFLSRLAYWPIRHDMAVLAGTYRYTYMRAGRPLAVQDTLMAAHAVRVDATLVTANVRDFPMPELKLLSIL